MMYRALVGLIVVACSFFAFAQEQTTPAKATDTSAVAVPQQQTEQVFTLQQLSTYNGKNGKPMYVAVDGVVYDVSNVKVWVKGKGQHNGGKAGTDISAKIEKAPHKKKVLEHLKKVGTLTSDGKK